MRSFLEGLKNRAQPPNPCGWHGPASEIQGPSHFAATDAHTIMAVQVVFFFRADMWDFLPPSLKKIRIAASASGKLAEVPGLLKGFGSFSSHFLLRARLHLLLASPLQQPRRTRERRNLQRRQGPADPWGREGRVLADGCLCASLCVCVFVQGCLLSTAGQSLRCLRRFER